MRAQEFINLVAEMMSAQADYFKSRTQTDLIRSKELEKRVRKALAEGISIPVETVSDVRVHVSDSDKQISLFE